MTAHFRATPPVHWGTWPAWLDQAREDGITPACEGVDQAMFFPDNGGGALGDVLQAKAICRGCPLLRPCRAWALEQPARWLYGVWGATSRGERMARAPRGEQPPGLRKHNN